MIHERWNITMIWGDNHNDNNFSIVNNFSLFNIVFSEEAMFTKPPDTQFPTFQSITSSIWLLF